MTKSKSIKLHVEPVYYFSEDHVGIEPKKIDIHLREGEYISNAFFSDGYLWVVSNQKRLWKSTNVNTKYLDLVEVRDDFNSR